MSRPAVNISASHIEELEKLLKEVSRADEAKTVQCVLIRARDKRSAEEIAAIVGMHPNSVRRIWKTFLDEGIESLKRGLRGKHRSHENLPWEEEQAFLQQFEQRAETGGLVTTQEIYNTYNETIGHTSAKTTIYRMLNRHGWRKIRPRPKHPNQNKEAQSLFKKTIPMTLLPLPPHSPELNPVECFWKKLRTHWFSNSIFQSMDALEEHLVSALRELEASPKRIQSLTGFDWIINSLKAI